MRRMFRVAGGTDRMDMMVNRLQRHSELSEDGARVVVQILERARSNTERFNTLSPYLGADASRAFLKHFNYT